MFCFEGQWIICAFQKFGSLVSKTLSLSPGARCLKSRRVRFEDLLYDSPAMNAATTEFLIPQRFLCMIFRILLSLDVALKTCLLFFASGETRFFEMILLYGEQTEVQVARTRDDLLVCLR